ncbi:hypothetical protein C8J56DRAFT_1159977, partial [Mycena floridula]
MAATDSKIAEVREMLEALTRRRAKIKQSFAAAKEAFSAIRQMPAEIIGEIVLLALADSKSSQILPISLSLKEGHWIYSQVCFLSIHCSISLTTFPLEVCRIWRTEILSRSLLWSNIDITFHPSKISRPRPLHTRPLLETIVSRSGHHPIQLRSIFDWTDIRLDTHEARAILKAVVK